MTELSRRLGLIRQLPRMRPDEQDACMLALAQELQAEQAKSDEVLFALQQCVRNEICSQRGLHHDAWRSVMGEDLVHLHEQATKRYDRKAPLLKKIGKSWGEQAPLQNYMARASHPTLDDLRRLAEVRCEEAVVKDCMNRAVYERLRDAYKISEASGHRHRLYLHDSLVATKRDFDRFCMRTSGSIEINPSARRRLSPVELHRGIPGRRLAIGIEGLLVDADVVGNPLVEEDPSPSAARSDASEPPPATVHAGAMLVYMESPLGSPNNATRASHDCLPNPDDSQSSTAAESPPDDTLDAPHPTVSSCQSQLQPKPTNLVTTPLRASQAKSLPTPATTPALRGSKRKTDQAAAADVESTASDLDHATEEISMPLRKSSRMTKTHHTIPAKDRNSGRVSPPATNHTPRLAQRPPAEISPRRQNPPKERTADKIPARNTKSHTPPPPPPSSVFAKVAQLREANETVAGLECLCAEFRANIDAALSTPRDERLVTGCHSRVRDMVHECLERCTALAAVFGVSK